MVSLLLCLFVIDSFVATGIQEVKSRLDLSSHEELTRCLIGGSMRRYPVSQEEA